MREGMMIACGIIAIAILFVFSSFISLMITFVFGLPESYLGPLMLASSLGLILLLVYSDIREQAHYAKERKADELASEIRSRKCALKIQARDFPDSRANIAREKRYEEMRNAKSSRLYDDIEPIYE